MSVAHCHQKITSPEMPVQGHGKVPEAKTIHMLGFGIGNERYGIDLKEAVEVIRDLVIMQSCTSTSMTERFVKCNRRNTIVFNLDQCLTIQGEHPAGRKPASLFLLEEKIQDSCVGILVPGIPSIVEDGFTGTRHGRGHTIQKKTPVRGIIRTPVPCRKGHARNSISLINLRELVENCIVQLRYMTPLHYTSN